VPVVHVVAASSDVVPAVTPDLPGQVIISHQPPRAAVVGGAVPVAVAVNEIETAEADEVVVPPVGNIKAVIVEVDKIGIVAYDNNRASIAQAEMHV